MQQPAVQLLDSTWHSKNNFFFFFFLTWKLTNVVRRIRMSLD